MRKLISFVGALLLTGALLFSGNGTTTEDTAQFTVTTTVPQVAKIVVTNNIDDLTSLTSISEIELNLAKIDENTVSAQHYVVVHTNVWGNTVIEITANPMEREGDGTNYLPYTLTGNTINLTTDWTDTVVTESFTIEGTGGTRFVVFPFQVRLAKNDVLHAVAGEYEANVVVEYTTT